MSKLAIFLTLIALSLGLPVEARSRGETQQLKSSLALAEPGDFLVTIQGKMHTLLHIYDRQGQRIIIEEVTVPKGRIPQQDFSWREWIRDGAPGHTAWVMYEIDMEYAQILEFYSFSQRSWGDVSQSDNFLCTMLQLPLEKLGQRDRKKVGPRPIAGEMDRRRLWQPRLVVDGERISGVEFDAWRTYWPRDGSELSGKKIDLYLPSNTTEYLAYFPAWLEVSGTVGRAQLRIIDSGKNLKSPQTSMPRRPPEFAGKGSLSEEGMTFRVHTPHYYEGFLLFASAMESGIKQLIELPHEVLQGNEDGEVLVKVSKEDLESRLKKGHHYSFVLQPTNYPEVGAETYDSWLWR